MKDERKEIQVLCFRISYQSDWEVKDVHGVFIQTHPAHSSYAVGD